MNEENSELMEKAFLSLRTVFKHNDFKSALQKRVVQAVISGVYRFENILLNGCRFSPFSGL